MSQELLAEEKVRLKKAYLLEAEKSFEGMFGTGTLEELVTFTQREDRAAEMVDRLWQWMMEKQIGLDERVAEDLRKRQCPTCGGLGKHREKDKECRDVIGKRGHVIFERESYYCGRCRKVFFPSGPAS